MPTNSTTEPIVTLTPAAVRQVKNLITRKGDSSLGLRLGVKGGGCSGLSYTLRLDAETRERDLVYEVEGVRVMVDPKSAQFLQGATLDFTLKNIMEGGFVFQNPNASRTCGCGTSFQPAK